MGLRDDLRTEFFYIEHAVTCMGCDKLFVPNDDKASIMLQVPHIMVNNWCSRKCYDESMGKVMVDGS